MTRKVAAHSPTKMLQRSARSAPFFSTRTDAFQETTFRAMEANPAA